MTGEQIKERITFNNKKIDEILDPSIFILQPEVQKYLKANEYLRNICKHSFKDGVCIYCGVASDNP